LPQGGSICAICRTNIWENTNFAKA